MRIVGLFLFLLALMVGIGSNLAIMFDPASFIIVFFGTLGMLWFGGGSLVGMFKSVFSSAVSEAEIRAAATDWQKARFYSLTTGLLGTFIGWIIMLKNMDDPAAIGPGMAICLLTSMYALVSSFGICLPLQVGLAKRVQMEQDNSIVISAVMAALILVLHAFVIYGSLMFAVPSK
jgi:flagellar motor component MotA